jgi:hypothetical protein
MDNQENEQGQSEKGVSPRRTAPQPMPKNAKNTKNTRPTQQERQSQTAQGGVGPMAEPTSPGDDFETLEAIDREEAEDLQRYARDYRRPTDTLERARRRDRGLSR